MSDVASRQKLGQSKKPGSKGSKTLTLEEEDLVTPVKKNVSDRRNRKGKHKDQEKLDKSG